MYLDNVHILTPTPGENNLSFIETSALDASNVELAFQNILTGTIPPAFITTIRVPRMSETMRTRRQGPARHGLAQAAGADVSCHPSALFPDASRESHTRAAC